VVARRYVVKIKLTPQFAEEHQKALAALGVDVEKARSWKTKMVEIDLALIQRSKLPKLLELVEPKAKPRTALAVVTRDIKTWMQAINSGGGKARNCEQLAALLAEELRRVPGHRLYQKDENDNWLAYYVESVKYHPPSGRGMSSPASVSVSLFYEELGVTEKHTLNYSQDDCKRFPLDSLANDGFFVETEDRRNDYLAIKERFFSIVNEVGKQFTATGTGDDNLDGNPKFDTYGGVQTVQLDIGGKPTRVVIDVFREEDRGRQSRDDKPDFSFWTKRSVNSDDAEREADELLEDADDDQEFDADFDPDAIEVHEIPVHPICAVFDLKRHLRMRVHVGNLTEYAYNTDLGKSLVLPPDVRRLVNLLMVQKGDFRDIIEDKGGGAPILCAGPPGVGKTLTAEVYSEVMERPLYSVQCSQLGLTPESLEAALLKSFRRANRWNAILLLDEADVYVRARGDDLKQNAIVGVFLRVIEYYGGVLFLTTNRSDKVDDAIISRCIARIDYQSPDVTDQKSIWRILADTAGVTLSDATIDEIVEANPDLTGRDIKNMLKLGRMFARSEKKALTVETINFSRRFKPATDQRKQKDVKR
jgi:hypothetical protein